MDPRKLSVSLLCASLLAACSEPQTPDNTGATSATTGASVPTQTAATSTQVAPTVPPPGSTPPTATAGPIEKLSGPYVLTFQQSGGIAGMRMETVIDTAKKTITYGGPRNQKPESREISAEDIAAVTRALEEARFAAFPGKIKGGPVADAFTYTITLRAGGKEYMVSWEDGTSVPDSYSAVRSAVTNLRNSKFGGGTPSTAPTI